MIERAERDRGIEKAERDRGIEREREIEKVRYNNIPLSILR